MYCNAVCKPNIVYLYVPILCLQRYFETPISHGANMCISFLPIHSLHSILCFTMTPQP